MRRVLPHDGGGSTSARADAEPIAAWRDPTLPASADHDDDRDAVDIDVCVCTFRRSAPLRRLLESLAAQHGAPRFRVVVADNHAEPVEAAQVAHLSQRLSLAIDYVHAPAGNIAIARNACLDQVRAAFVAFIDDDEIAAPDWLARLVAAVHDADVVFGRVQAEYDASAPAWQRVGDFHSKQPALRGRDGCITGHTANVLMRRSVIAMHRFDPALGRSGGEDTVFFAQLRQAGARLRIAPDARVSEPVPHERATLAWLARRARGSGHAHARMLHVLHRRRLGIVLSATLKVGYCVIATVATLASPVRWRRNWLRANLHLGVLLHALGAADRALYGDDTNAASPSQATADASR